MCRFTLARANFIATAVISSKSTGRQADIDLTARLTVGERKSCSVVLSVLDASIRQILCSAANLFTGSFNRVDYKAGRSCPREFYVARYRTRHRS
jgi:hypothetical protein